MAMKEFKTSGFSSGVQNKIPTEKIAQDAASTSLGWITEDGNIFLSYGRQLVGSDGPQGGIFGEIFAPKKDGTRVHFRKANTKIQYFSGTTWVDIIIGLTARLIIHLHLTYHLQEHMCTVLDQMDSIR